MSVRAYHDGTSLWLRCEDGPDDLSRLICAIDPGDDFADLAAAVTWHEGRHRCGTAPGLTPVEAARVAVAEEWQPMVDALRGLLDEIGVLAANAPEDGDCFDLLQDIAMRIAAHDVPDDGRHPDACPCQFCREDEREERARQDRENLDDDDAAERDDVLRMRREMAREAGDDDDGACPECGMRHKYADDEL